MERVYEIYKRTVVIGYSNHYTMLLTNQKWGINDMTKVCRLKLR